MGGSVPIKEADRGEAAMNFNALIALLILPDYI